MADLKGEYLNKDRTSELWTAIKTHVALELEDYATHEGVATAIVTALQKYPDNEALAKAITDALEKYMTASEVNKAILQAIGDITRLTIETTEKLPDPREAKENIIYLVPAEESQEENEKNEYLFVNGKFEKIGSTKVDLSGYWSKEELQPMSKEDLQSILV